VSWFRAKLNIIEQEFKYAEKTEKWRIGEEEEMRRSIQANSNNLIHPISVANLPP
jgi:hypothetical protein